MRTCNIADERSARIMATRARKRASWRNVFKVSMLVVALMLLWAMPAYATEGGAAPEGTAAVDQAVTATGQGEAEDAIAEAAPVTAEEPVVLEETEDAAAEDQTEDVEGEAADQPEADAETAADEGPAGETAVTAVGDPASELCEDCAGDNGAALEECEDAEKYLELICGEGAFGIFWESRADYDAGLLSIRYRLRNTSTDTTLNNIRIVSATANAGVKVDNLTPKLLGSLAAGDWMYFTLKWLVPKGVGGFVTDLSICADCETLCEGDDCEPVCEGDDCEPEPVCEGEGCNPAVDDGQEPPVDNRVSEPLSSSALPRTGADLSLLISLGLSLMMAGAMLPATRMVRQKKH